MRGDEALCVTMHDVEEDYSGWLLGAVERTLAGARVEFSAVELYAVASGPGSFTGLRIGLTTVKAWSEVQERPISAVSRLEALAAEAKNAAPYVAVFVDAQRGQVFGAMYTRASERKQERFERVGEEMVIGPGEFVAWVLERAGDRRVQWISPDPTCIAGLEAWTARRDRGETIAVIAPILAPAIGRLGRRLALEGKTTNALALDANYVRRSDAEIFWKGGPGGAR